ncbi:glycosyltransferase family 2 protein [Patescibacteria group bacterium]
MSIKVTISIVTWNSGNVINSCLLRIREQTFSDYETIVVDNNSSDDTRAILEQFPWVTVIQKNENTGFSAPHNEVIRKSESEYVLCMNPDVFLTPRFLELIIKAAEQRPEMGSFGGKLLRGTPLIMNEQNGIIDSTGILITKTFRAINRGEGEVDKKQYDSQNEVLGQTGALVLYRKKALEDIRFEHEYFDVDFFAYKEDVDLAWRLQRKGYSSYYEPSAIAFHIRQVRRGSRSQRKNTEKHLSFKNHILMLVKNISIKRFILNAIWIIPYELLKIIYLILFERETLASIPLLTKQLKRIIVKRKYNFKSF